MKRSFFQAAVTSILLYGWTTWTLTKRLEKKLDGNYTRMLRAILNNTPQDTNCTATCLLSRKLFELDEPDMQDTSGEAETNSKRQIKEGRELTNQEKIRTLGEKATYKYLEILEADSIKQVDMNSYGPPHMAEQKQDDRHEHTFSNYVRIWDVVQKTCQRRWTIGRSGERGSGISVRPARDDDDDDDEWLCCMYCFYWQYINLPAPFFT